MARSDPAVSLRAPSHARGGGPERREPDDGRPPLTLVVTRGRLGVELSQPHVLSPLRVEDLALSFPDVRFPVELSGGVKAFRHRRGRLERLALSLPVGDAQRWGARRLRDLLGAELVHHVAAPLEDGWLVGVASHDAALAFEVLLSPLGDDLRLFPTAARGLGLLPAPPQALAVRALHALLKPYARVRGGALVVERAASLAVQELLPLAGMRAPTATGLSWIDARFEVDRVTLRAERDAAPIELTMRGMRTAELCALVAEAEQALVDGDLEEARRGYLAVLAQAPRHPELVQRLAEVDRAVGGRAEAALDTLSDAMPPAEAGVLGAALLAETGDRTGAAAAFIRAAEQEPYGPLAALAWLEVARLDSDASATDAALDEAVARAPMLAAVRWQRFERRMAAARLKEARADVEHLEAAASSAHERHAVARRAAALFDAQGLYDEAAAMYERALRYAPDGIDAVAGLGRALEALGRPRRALELFGRAVALADRKRLQAYEVRIGFARLLAEVADDRPAAVAHVRGVPPTCPEVFDARLLEARWRSELGDLAGAGEALGRLADAVDAAIGALIGEPGGSGAGQDGLGRWPRRDDARVAIAELLVEGARIHDIDRRDRAAARRLASLALRLAPTRARVQRAFRKLAADPPALRSPPAAVPSPPAAVPSQPGSVEPTTPPTRVLAEASPLSLTLDVDSGSDAASEEDERQADQLAARLRAQPGDEGLAAALMAVLERLGRDHELLALVSARIDDAPPTARGELLGRRRRVLGRLLARALAEGKESEAALYRSLAEQDG